MDRPFKRGDFVWFEISPVTGLGDAEKNRRRGNVVSINKPQTKVKVDCSGDIYYVPIEKLHRHA
jgi:hypothetical protein